MSTILIIILILLVFGGGWGYMNRDAYGNGPIGIVGILVIILLVYLLFGSGRVHL